MITLPHSHNGLISMLDTVLHSEKAYYLAVPVTSGIRLWRLAQELGTKNLDEIRYSHQGEFERDVFVPNLAKARSLARELRKEDDSIQIVNPSVLTVDHWGPEDYRSFWRHVIRLRVSRLYLAPDWQYSHGCVEECTEAFNVNIPVFSTSGSQVNEINAYQQVSNAIEKGLCAGFNVSFLLKARDLMRPGPSLRIRA